jgi:hypothetical protein
MADFSSPLFRILLASLQGYTTKIHITYESIKTKRKHYKQKQNFILSIFGPFQPKENRSSTRTLFSYALRSSGDPTYCRQCSYTAGFVLKTTIPFGSCFRSWNSFYSRSLSPSIISPLTRAPPPQVLHTLWAIGTMYRDGTAVYTLRNFLYFIPFAPS